MLPSARSDSQATTSMPGPAGAGVPRAAVARAADGPAPTLVLDLRSSTSIDGGAAFVEVANRTRRRAMERKPQLGAKTMVLIDVTGDVVELEFMQGLHDGSIDPAIRVCLNSAACALTVARHVWDLVPDGPLTVVMGGRTFGYEELAG